MKTSLQSPLPYFIFVAMLVAVTITSTEEEAVIYTAPIIEQIEPVEEPIEIKKAPEPAPVVDNTLKKIAWCESHNQQFNADGSVLRGIQNPLDIGKWQINEKYHLAESLRLGMDIHTLEGNTAYANHLYLTQGSTPWNWSRFCWADPDRVWIERGGELWSK